MNYLIKRFLPDIYSNNETMAAIVNASAGELLKLKEDIKLFFENSFIESSHEDGITKYEKLLTIAPDVGIPLDTRRKIVLNKIGIRDAYTRRALVSNLNAVFGEGNWKYELDYESEVLIIDIEEANLLVYERAMDDIRDMIPASLSLIKAIVEAYTHRYLQKTHTHEELEQFTYGELSKYSAFKPYDFGNLEGITFEEIEGLKYKDLSPR